MRAEQEDVARHALDRPVFVHGADEGLVGIEHDAIVGDLRDRAAAGERREPRRTPGPQRAGDAIAVQQRPAAADARRSAFAQHLDHVVVIGARKIGVGRRLADEIVHAVFRPLAARHLGDDLLREDVERGDR